MFSGMTRHPTYIFLLDHLLIYDTGLMMFGSMAKRIQKQHEGEPHKPEWRLPPIIPGAIAIPIGLFLYGWAAEKQVQWIVPLIGTALVEYHPHISHGSLALYA